MQTTLIMVTSCFMRVPNRDHRCSKCNIVCFVNQADSRELFFDGSDVINKKGVNSWISQEPRLTEPDEKIVLIPC